MPPTDLLGAGRRDGTGRDGLGRAARCRIAELHNGQKAIETPIQKCWEKAGEWGNQNVHLMVEQKAAIRPVNYLPVCPRGGGRKHAHLDKTRAPKAAGALSCHLFEGKPCRVIFK